MSSFLSSDNPDFLFTDRQDALDWCIYQNTTPVPCTWGTKKAVPEVWKRTLEKKGFVGCGGFLVDHPARRAAIDRIWNTRTSPLQHLNISLVTGWDRICSIDCDSARTMKLAETLIDAPKVTSKRGGKFILRLIGDAPAQVRYKTTKGKVELEFFSKGKHVLIFGLHPEPDSKGNPVPYRLYPKDIPELTWDQIETILIRISTQVGLTEGVIRSSSKKKIESDVISKAYSRGVGHSISDWFNLPNPPLPVNGIQTADGFQGMHPTHGSTSGKPISTNYSVTNDGRWFCFAHHSGGDRFMWLLIEHGIISCEEAIPKEGHRVWGWAALTRRQQMEANDLLKKLYPERYEEYRSRFPKTGGTKKVRGGVETSIEVLPDSLANHHVTLLNGLARIGKSTFGVKCLLDEGRGLFVAHTHSVMENAMRLMKEMWTERRIFDKTACAVTGKIYACNDETRKGRCAGCPKAPKNPTDEEKPGISVLALDTIAKDLLQRNRMLTIDDIPSEYCPYHVMMHAHDNADFVFLVTFFSSVDDDTRRVRSRGLCVIDEGPTCEHYRAPCAEVATYQRFRHGGGLVIPAWADTHERWFATLKEYVEHRLDDEEGNPPKRRLGAVDECIISTLEKLLAVYAILIQFNLAPTVAGLAKTTEELSKIDFKNDYSRDFKMEVLRKVEEYSKEAGVDSNAMDELFVISLYPGEASFSWQGDNPSKLFFASDDSLYLIPEFEKLLVIGASQGEEFIRDYAKARGITDVYKIHVTGFPYPKNYHFYRLIGSSEDKIKRKKEEDPDAEIDQVKTQRAQFSKLIRAIHTNNISKNLKCPALLITASKLKQDAIHKSLQAGSSLITNHRVKDVWREVYIPGNIGIYTQNSCISRGIDVQFFDRVFFNPGEFATPAITARIQYLEEKIKEEQWKGLQEGNTSVDVSAMEDEIAELKNRRAEIQTDEITNNVLRSAPIPSDPSSAQRLKIVVMTENDFQKLDYRIKNIVESTTIDDEQDINLIIAAMNSIHHAVGGTDINLDRPSPIPLEKTEPEPVLSLEEQHRRIANYLDYHVQCIDRTRVPYEKFVNMMVDLPGFAKTNKKGVSKRITKKALIKYFFTNKNTHHIPEKAIKDCISLALSERLLLDEYEDGKIFYRLHPNTIAYKEGKPLRGPDYPKSLEIIHKNNF